MIPTLIASAMLIGCLINGLPYGYFQILRWVVCGVCGYRAYLAYTLNKKVWMWVFVASAVLFNPIAPIHLDRNLWAVIDVAMAVVLLVSLRTLKARKET
jgi:hypothetical protein